MARAETLEILAGIIDELAGIGEAERGTPLRSDDWNTLVGSVTGLARLVASRERTFEEQLETRFAPADHVHRGAATLAWFEPETRALLEAASSGSVETRLGQQKLEKELGAVRGEVRGLRDELEQLRLSLDQLRDSDFARERSIGRVARDVEVLRRLEGGVENLTGRVNGLNQGITDVISFRDRLEGDGAPIDVRGLGERVASLEGLRANLLTAEGEVVRIREMQARITRLETGRVSRDEIDGLIVARVSDARIFEDAGLLDGISARVEASLDPRIAGAESEIAGLRDGLGAVEEAMGPLDARIAAVDGRVAAQDARIEGLSTLAGQVERNDGRLTTAEARLAEATAATARIDALGRSVTEIGRRVDGFGDVATLAQQNATAIRGLDTRTRALELSTRNVEGLTGRVAVLEDTTAGLPALTTRIGAVEDQAGTLGTRVEIAEAELATLEGSAARIAGLERSSAELAEWRTGADRRIAQLFTGGSTAVEERLTRLEENVSNQAVALTTLTRRVDAPNRPDIGVRPGGGVTRPIG